MSIDYEQDRQRYRVRWREGTGSAAAGSRPKRRPNTSRRPSAGRRWSLRATRRWSPTGTASTPTGPPKGQRWRFVFRQSDRSLTTRRGFTSRSAAQAARAAAVEEVRRGDVVVSRGTFGEFWAQLLEAKRPYVTAGTLQDYKTHGRKRLLPWFGELRLAAIDEDRVREWIGEMSELVADGELSAKTVNNARTCLSMTLGEAVRRRHLTQNPCRYVPELPVERAGDRLPATRRDRALPRRLPRALPPARRVPHRHRSPDLRSARRPLDRPRRGHRRRPHRAPARARGQRQRHRPRASDSGPSRSDHDSSGHCAERRRIGALPRRTIDPGQLPRAVGVQPSSSG